MPCYNPIQSCYMVLQPAFLSFSLVKIVTQGVKVEVIDIQMLNRAGLTAITAYAISSAMGLRHKSRTSHRLRYSKH